ncbi:MAG: hypothetical protein ACREUX_19050 [Burkholderiales bacterium]
MLVIRESQLAAFADASQAGFERRLRAGLAEPFPQCAARSNETALAALVRLGIEKAAAHGLEAEAEVQSYLHLMLLLGSHWEQDPQSAWAAAMLADAAHGTAAQRVGALWERAQAWRQRVMGEGDGQHLAAVRYVLGRSVEELCKNPSRSQRDLLIQFAAVHSRKFAEVGEQGLYDLTRLAVEACKRFDLADRWAVVLMAQFMFLFGAGFLGDPLYAWAHEALTEAAGAGVDEKLERLLRAARAHMSAQVAP